RPRPRRIARSDEQSLLLLLVRPHPRDLRRLKIRSGRSRRQRREALGGGVGRAGLPAAGLGHVFGSVSVAIFPSPGDHLPSSLPFVTLYATTPDDPPDE